MARRLPARALIAVLVAVLYDRYRGRYYLIRYLSTVYGNRRGADLSGFNGYNDPGRLGRAMSTFGQLLSGVAWSQRRGPYR